MPANLPGTAKVTLRNPLGGSGLTVNAPANNIPGLIGDYYGDRELTGEHAVRIDKTVDFDWPNGGPPGVAISPDGTYSERWHGYVRCPLAGSWTFYTTSDDGVRLWVDDILRIDNWTDHGPTEDVATFMCAGWKKIRLEHYNRWSPFGVQGTIKLEYSGPGQVRTVIPESRLNVNPAGAVALPLVGADGRTYRLSIAEKRTL